LQPERYAPCGSRPACLAEIGSFTHEVGVWARVEIISAVISREPLRLAILTRALDKGRLHRRKFLRMDDEATSYAR